MPLELEADIKFRQLYAHVTQHTMPLLDNCHLYKPAVVMVLNDTLRWDGKTPRCYRQ